MPQLKRKSKLRSKKCFEKYGVWRPNSSVLQDIWHKLVDDDALSEDRNNVKIKHATAGANIWNSLTSDFKLELLGQRWNGTVGSHSNGSESIYKGRSVCTESINRDEDFTTLWDGCQII